LARAEHGATRPRLAHTRRSTEEVRRLVLASARRLFSIHGYGGTSTRDIASDAGVTAPAIYRHFGSKERLFEAAVEQPLHVAVDGFLQDWEFLGPDRANNAAAVRLYMKSLVRLLKDNRDLVTAYLHNRSHDDTEESVLSHELSSVVERVRSAITDQGLVGVDVPVVVRCVTGMVLSLVLYDDFLFPPDDHPSQDRILNEVVALTLRGIESRETPAK
jgi:AcrR family transcriptional regulator